jgi:hypothetical protein
MTSWKALSAVAVISDEERRRRIDAYLASAADEEKGAVMLALFGHAVIFLLLFAAETIWLGSTVTRLWRRRELGVTQAVRTGVHKPSLVVLFAAHVLYLLLRRAGIAKLDQRSREYMVDKRGTSATPEHSLSRPQRLAVC